MSATASSNAEARVLSLEREVYRLYHQVVGMNTWRARALEEGLAMSWTGWRNRRCPTTIQGFVVGMKEDDLIGAQVRFIGHDTDEDYGTFTADNGAGSALYTATLFISNEDSSVDVYVSFPDDDGRFDGEAIATLDPDGDDLPASEIEFNRCSSSSLSNIMPAVGADYIAEWQTPGFHTDNMCNWPIKKVLEGTDTGNAGTITITWDPSYVAPAAPLGAWIGTHGGLTYTLEMFNFRLRIAPPGAPPGGYVGVPGTGVCPDPTTATKFSQTHTAVFGTRTVEFHET